MSDPLFGIVLTLACYLLFLTIQKRTNIDVLNPLLFSSILIIIILKLFNISYDSYNEGGKIVSFLVGPATVSLAIPLYENLDLIKKNFKVISISIISGVLIHAVSIIVILLILNVDQSIGLSLLPKSITTAIAMDVSKNNGGIVEITVAAVVITGIVGATLSPLLNNMFNIKKDESIGLALGSSAHAVGTARAASVNSIQGSFSSVSLILTGILTVIIAPLLTIIYLFLS